MPTTRHAHNRPVGESAPEKELTASRDLTASKKPRAEIGKSGEVRVGHRIC